MKKLTSAFMLLCLVACSSFQVPDSPQLAAKQNWLLMPLVNHANTPYASESAEQILATLMFAEGIELATFNNASSNELVNMLQSDARTEAAKAWAEEQGARYVLSGSVDEWQYKNGLDGEPAVGVSLILTDNYSGEVIWRASGTRSGWGRENLTATGQKVLAKLISGLQLPSDK